MRIATWNIRYDVMPDTVPLQDSLATLPDPTVHPSTIYRLTVTRSVLEGMTGSPRVNSARSSTDRTRRSLVHAHAHLTTSQLVIHAPRNRHVLALSHALPPGVDLPGGLHAAAGDVRPFPPRRHKWQWRRRGTGDAEHASGQHQRRAAAAGRRAIAAPRALRGVSETERAHFPHGRPQQVYP